MQPSSQLWEEREAKGAEDNAIDEKWEAGQATIKGKKGTYKRQSGGARLSPSLELCPPSF